MNKISSDNNNNYGIAEKYLISDKFWEIAKNLLPEPKPKKKSGRPKIDARKTLNAIFYILRTGCQWNALPRSLGASSTVHDRFQEWTKDGFFKRLWQAGLVEYDELKSIDWKWMAMDGAMTKAPLGKKSDWTQPHGSRQERS